MLGPCINWFKYFGKILEARHFERMFHFSDAQLQLEMDPAIRWFFIQMGYCFTQQLGCQASRQWGLAKRFDFRMTKVNQDD